MNYYAVLRWCCNSGLCLTCHRQYDGTRDIPAPESKRALVVQYATTDPVMAQKVCTNWQAYGARVVHPVTDATLGVLEPSSRQWLEEWLGKRQVRALADTGAGI